MSDRKKEHELYGRMQKIKGKEILTKEIQRKTKGIKIY